MVTDSNQHDPDFIWNDLIIRQDELVHKVGTDAILLGTWVCSKVQDAKLVLDAGAGSGILALMMARHFPDAQIVAADIDEHSLSLAGYNFANSKFHSRLLTLDDNIVDLPKSGQRFDLIVSNPPFYNTHNPSLQEHKKRARHGEGPVEEWVEGCLNRMQPDGHVFLIVPGHTAHEWIRAANDMRYYNQFRLNVFSFAEDLVPVRSLLCFGGTIKKPAIDRLVLYQHDRSPTDAYRRLSQIKFA